MNPVLQRYLTIQKDLDLLAKHESGTGCRDWFILRLDSISPDLIKITEVLNRHGLDLEILTNHANSLSEGSDVLSVVNNRLQISRNITGALILKAIAHTLPD